MGWFSEKVRAQSFGVGRGGSILINLSNFMEERNDLMIGVGIAPKEKISRGWHLLEHESFQQKVPMTGKARKCKFGFVVCTEFYSRDYEELQQK